MIQKSGYLHWQLWNCGNNLPQVVGNPLAIVAQQFDMRPNPTTAVITDAVYDSNQIKVRDASNCENFAWISHDLVRRFVRLPKLVLRNVLYGGNGIGFVCHLCEPKAGRRSTCKYVRTGCVLCLLAL
jgi:hypothetical protein